MGARIRKTITPQVDPDGIAVGQTLSGGVGVVQDFTLNGILSVSGTFTATDSAHIIEITSTGDDSLLTFTVFGTDSRDVPVSESISGAIALGKASTTNHFKTVTKVSSSGNTTGNVEIGVSGLCVSPWTSMNQGEIVDIGLFVVLSTSADLTWQIEHTPDNIQQNADVTFDTFPQPDLIDQITSVDGNYAFPATSYRLKVTVFTSGDITFTSWQAY